MELNVYDIIKKAVLTPKSWELLQKLGKLTFEVHCAANKSVVKDAVEKIWNVKVDKVCIMNVRGKNKVFARRQFSSSDRKKAIITLKKGYKIELPGQFEAMGAAQQNAANHEQLEGK